MGNLAVDSIVHVMTRYRAVSILNSIRTLVVDHLEYFTVDNVAIACPNCQSFHDLNALDFISSSEEYVGQVVDRSDFESIISDMYPEIRAELLLDFMDSDRDHTPDVIAGVRNWLADYLSSMKHGVRLPCHAAVFAQGENVMHTSVQAG